MLPIGLQTRTYDGDPADLLQDGRTDFAPAAAITLYFDCPRERFADGVIACWEELLGGWGSSLRWYADDTLGRWREATPRRLRRPIDTLASRKPMLFYAWQAITAEHYDHASPVTFQSIVRDTPGKKLSYIRATFPTARVDDEASAAEFVETAKRWCARIPIRHGYGGLTLNQAAQRGPRQINSGMLPPIARRFPGFEIDDCGGTVLVASEQIKGINWLTMLDDGFVQRLGGLPALRDQLSPAVALHPAGEGAVIVQAGPVPTRGDTQANDDLSLYREVARALRPVCLDWHPDLGPPEHGSLDAEKTKRWLRRFN